MVAIALIAVGGLDLLLGLVTCCGRIAAGLRGSSTVSDDPARAAGYATYAVLGSLSLAVGALVLAGGIALLQRRSRSLGVAAAIAALLPISCCFLAGIPVGIWALIVL